MKRFEKKVFLEYFGLIEVGLDMAAKELIVTQCLVGVCIGSEVVQ